VGRVTIEVLSWVLVRVDRTVMAGTVEVTVLTVDKTTETSVAVTPLREVVDNEVPCKSIVTVVVVTGRVVDFEITLVAWKVEVKVWPGKTVDLTM
jgi:hypothetical protein